ncbi:hypothetical protein KDAU_39220 [Dictyobacter aurantiacus]|uniref:BclA C-terminal domain-containing protein n=2 Tax=Dictyobacter aurantiacus TaxID=1936993 RepID=A0A401ZIC9_9CHLR|nr:hypothetical protein KDAU_39220 [Dictyobacter aurantiacus]
MGPSGPSGPQRPGYAAVNIQAITISDTPVDVATITVPSGSYLVTASSIVNYNSAEAIVTCQLTTGNVQDASVAGAGSAGQSGLAPYGMQTLSLTDNVTLTSPGTIAYTCVGTAGLSVPSAYIENSSITASPVLNIQP